MLTESSLKVLVGLSVISTPPWSGGCWRGRWKTAFSGSLPAPSLFPSQEGLGGGEVVEWS